MAVVVTKEKSNGDRRTLLVTYFVNEQDETATQLLFAPAETAVLARAQQDWGVKPRDYSFRELSKHLWRFTLEYSLHTIRQHDAAPTDPPETEVVEAPQLFLPEPRSLVRNLEVVQRSTGASQNALPGIVLSPTDEAAVLVEPPKQNATLLIDLPTEEKAALFYPALRKCWGKLNDGTFQGHDAGCFMILTAAATSPPGALPRLEIGCAIGEKLGVSFDGNPSPVTLADVHPYSYLGLEVDDADDVVGPRDTVQAGGDVSDIHEVRVFEEADYSELDLPEPA